MSTFSIVPFQSGYSSRVPSIFTSLFDDFDSSPRRSISYMPNANVIKEEDGHRIDIAIPGYDRNDVDVSVKGGTLTVQSETKDDSSNNYSHEFSVKAFKRQWTLPKNTNVEGIEATYKNGVLSLSIPTTEESHRKIKIG